MREFSVAVILPAAGAGRRFRAEGGRLPAGMSKLELDLCGKPVFLRAVEVFLSQPEVRQIILAVSPESMDRFRLRWGDQLGFLGVKLVAGGERERWETVMRGLEAVEAGVSHVAVHDAARPLASAELVRRVFEAARRYAAVVPGLAVVPTLKRLREEGRKKKETEGEWEDLLKAAVTGEEVRVLGEVAETVDRGELVEIQTPQVFEAGLLRRAYERIRDGKVDGRPITDDAGVVEAMGERVWVVEGEATNLKITRPADLELARAWVSWQEQQRAAKEAKKKLLVDEEEE